MLILLPLILLFVQLQVLFVVNFYPLQLSAQITCIINPSKYLFESVAKNDFRSS